jgi:hypothetical protein
LKGAQALSCELALTGLKEALHLCDQAFEGLGDLPFRRNLNRDFPISAAKEQERFEILRKFPERHVGGNA